MYCTAYTHSEPALSLHMDALASVLCTVLMVVFVCVISPESRLAAFVRRYTLKTGIT